ncbi:MULTISPECIES: tyrosine-type recombinase/integrase [Bacteria]|uniref:Integrase n=2 Tax=Brevibacterium TaxID=1696 RepID=A0A2A3YPC2_BREAU|nr:MULTISPECIES: tyrosine-type recombinase/integrase [Bacteria]MDN5545318.1 site-specific integrase [Rhodococcus sp. (in: high G+C Gram-positive bacteria)]AZL04289.1 integrase [Brevibacterium aurantiacum]AZT91840.1 integrase [Brevibacterium aurantiacum]AZT91855.1 integrase [Brevibacterium aurantiacum]AZT92733.1 integrase [Brevibacterium aurantiacum]
MKHNPITGAPDFFVFARNFLHSYLANVRKCSPATITAYRLSLECFLIFLTTVGGRPRTTITFDDCTRERVKAWIEWMNTTKKYAPRTVTLRLTALRAFLAFSAAEDLTLVAASKAIADVKPPRITVNPVDYLTTDHTSALLSAFDTTTVKSWRNQMMLIILYDTAARVSELTTLTCSDVHLRQPAQVRLKGKGNKTRVVPINTATTDHLGPYLAEFHPDEEDSDRPLFYTHHHGKISKLSTDSVSLILNQAVTIAQQECPTFPGRIHPHMLRKTKAMDLYQEGIPLPIIMRLLGHTNASTTQAFYAFATIDMMRQAITVATPTPTAPQLTDSQLEALYSLK